LHAACFARGWDEDSMQRYLGDPSCVVLLALCSGDAAPQGFLICKASAGEAEILTLAVAPEMRGQRIGEELWHAARGDLQSRGVDRVVLEVGTDYDAALALYRNLDFREAGRRKGYYQRANGEPRMDGLIMACDLGANEGR
jgi:ribosomal-protein-alanine N-acetyltransferase